VVAALVATSFVSDRIPVRNLALADSRRVVSITADGVNRIVSTDATTVGGVLARAEIKLGKNDLVEPGFDTKLPNGFYNINVYRAEPYRIVDGDHIVLTHSAHRSPRLIAQEAGLTIYAEDEVTTTQVNDFASQSVVGQQILIDRATHAMVSADGATRILRSQTATVSGLLADNAIKLGAKDKITPSLTAPLVPGLKITITRVADAEVNVKEKIPFSTKTINDSNLPKGTVTTQTPGVDGYRQVSYRIHYENGVETSRVTLGVSARTEPVTEVKIVGTKVQFAGSIEYWRPYVEEAAARWGVDANLMLAIMKCESGGRATASNGSHFGLYQYSAATWQAYGNSMNDIYDGPKQIDVTAGRLTRPNPTSPWLASKTCWRQYQ
jgi:resuscitation-promoting factor RpfB